MVFLLMLLLLTLSDLEGQSDVNDFIVREPGPVNFG